MTEEQWWEKHHPTPYMPKEHTFTQEQYDTAKENLRKTKPELYNKLFGHGINPLKKSSRGNFYHSSRKLSPEAARFRAIKEAARRR